jgi:hypothetical protein
MVFKKEDSYIFPANVDPDQPPFEIWQAGMDAMLIPMDIVRKIKESDPEIPFTCIGNPSVPGLENIPFIGEDNYFYKRTRDCGFSIMCDPRIQCLHCDLKSGKYAAHPSITPEKIKQEYFTNFPMTGPLTMVDKLEIDSRWISRLPSPGEKKDELQKNI